MGRPDEREGTSRSSKRFGHLVRDNGAMEKAAVIFASFDEAEEANAKNDERLTHAERIAIMIELRNRAHPDAFEQGLARVSRVVELESR